MYGISRITVRKALEQLTEDKILIKRHGKGTFVAKNDYVEVFEAGGSFTKSCLLMNAVPTTQILRTGLMKGPKEAEEQLGLQPGEEMVIIRRLRCIDGVPVIIEDDYFSEQYRFLLELNLRDKSLHQVLWEQEGIKLCRFQDIINVRFSDSEEARLLNCEEGHPLLRVCEQSYGTDKQILYYNEQSILTDHYKYAVRSMA